MWRQIKGVFLLVFFLFFVFNSFFFTPPTRNYTKREVEELNRIEREKKNAKNNTLITNNMTEQINITLSEFPSDDKGEKFYAEEEEFKIQQNNTIVVSEQIINNDNDEIIESDGVDYNNAILSQEEYDYIYEYLYETIYEFEEEQNGKQIFEEEEILIKVADLIIMQNETKQIELNNTLVEEEEFYYYYEEEEEINDKINTVSQEKVIQEVESNKQDAIESDQQNNIQEAESRQKDEKIQEIVSTINDSDQQDEQFISNAINQQKETVDNQKEVKETINDKENSESQDKTSQNFIQEYQMFDSKSNRTDNFTQSQVYLYYFANKCVNDQIAHIDDQKQRIDDQILQQEDEKPQQDDENPQINDEEHYNEEEITIILVFHSIILTLLLLITSLRPKQTLQRPTIEQIETNKELQELVQCMAQYIEQLDEQYKFIAQSQQKIALQLELLEQ